ncbi:MAG TPA: calcium-binding protein [Kofleriaceae bacterium]|nr:calcium-binding protein [Kofleriaceae bacterium]
MRLDPSSIGKIVIVMCVWLSPGRAEAQTAATCSFSEGTLTVALDGVPATLRRTIAGQIRLDNVSCAGATTYTTDFIQVNGSSFDDRLVIVGHSSFYPGLTREQGFASEIEIAVSLGAGSDTVTIYGYDSSEAIVLTSGGVDAHNDGDEDITIAGVERIKFHALAGNDTLVGYEYAGGGTLYFHGGEGDDQVESGTAGSDYLFGDEGNDDLRGGDGNDRLYGGPGHDYYWGGQGDDIFYADPIADGNDRFYGGDGIDTLSYADRTAGVTVTLGNGLSDDGEPGAESDFTDPTVENVIGGSGKDVLIGSGAGNTLTGNAGADDLFGGAGADTLLGGGGRDLLVGDAGDDTLSGGAGDDDLDGGADTDLFFGGAGDDVFINDDGVAETVDCGEGTLDDPEPSATDTFVACELI